MKAQDRTNTINFLIENCLKSKVTIQDKVKQQIASILQHKSVLLKAIHQYVFGKAEGHSAQNTIVFYTKEVDDVIHINRIVSEAHKKLVRDNKKYSALQLVLKSPITSVINFITKRMKIFAISDDSKTTWTLLIANPNYSSKSTQQRKEKSNKVHENKAHRPKSRVSAKNSYMNFLRIFTHKESRLSETHSTFVVKQGKTIRSKMRSVGVALRPVLERALFVKYDLHELFAFQAASVVRFSLKKAFTEFKNIITFIPGIGNHSTNGEAVLKPLTLGIVEKIQKESGQQLINSFMVPERNAGEVVVSFREPMLIQAPEFLKLGARNDDLIPEILDQIVAGINDRTRRFIITISKKTTLPKKTLEVVEQELATRALGIFNQFDAGAVRSMPVTQADKGTQVRLLFSYDNLDKKFYARAEDIELNAVRPSFSV